MITTIDARIASLRNAFAHPTAWFVTGGGIVAAALVTLLIWQVVRRVTSLPKHDRATLASYISAVVFASVSLDTNWRFFNDVLHITGNERLVMFGAIEIGLIACALNMRANVTKVDENGQPGSPGPARLVAWALCVAAALAAWVEAGPVAGTLRIVLGPIGSMIMLHLALGLDIRSATGRHHSSTWTKLASEWREWFLSFFGLGNDSRDAVTRRRDRATNRANQRRKRAANRAVRLIVGGRTPQRAKRLLRALRIADIASDPRMQARLIREVGTLQHVEGLLKLELPSPWTAIEDKPARRVSTSAAPAPQQALAPTAESPAPRPEPAATATAVSVEQDAPTEEFAKVVDKPTITGDTPGGKTNLVSIEHPTGRPEWVTSDMTPAEAMTAYLNHLGETKGVLLERWADSIGYRDKFVAGLGRKTLYIWRKQQSDAALNDANDDADADTLASGE